MLEVEAVVSHHGGKEVLLPFPPGLRKISCMMVGKYCGLTSKKRKKKMLLVGYPVIPLDNDCYVVSPLYPRCIPAMGPDSCCLMTSLLGFRGYCK